MSFLRFLAVLLVLVCGSASADVWRWVDADGKAHFVDTEKAIYTWRDKSGRVFYSDKKEALNAVMVQLVWHSSGSLADVEDETPQDNRPYAFEGETDAQRTAREEAEAFHCKRAREIYDSYLNAPKLYLTNAAGEKEFLSKEEMQKTIADTRVKMQELCR